MVLLSHNHYDHMDLPSLRALQRLHAPRFVTMLGNARMLARIGITVTELDWWDEITLADCGSPRRRRGISLPARRSTATARLWGGFMLGTRRGKSCLPAIPGRGPHWREIRNRLGAPDVALLPIGAYEPRWFMAPVHMNPAEAVEAHLALGAAAR